MHFFVKTKYHENFCILFFLTIFIYLFFSVMQPAVISYSKITFYLLLELMKHKTQGKDNFLRICN